MQEMAVFVAMYANAKHYGPKLSDSHNRTNDTVAFILKTDAFPDQREEKDTTKGLGTSCSVKFDGDCLI